MNPQITSKGTDLPITLSEAKSSQRITGSTEDTLHTAMLMGAIEVAEEGTGRALTENTYVLRLCGFSDPAFVIDGIIKIPSVPLKSVTSVKYYDTDDSLQTLATSVYEVNIYKEPGTIKLASGQSWPSLYDKGNNVEITYVAGYSNDGALDETPEKLKQAICLIFGEWNANREDYAGRRLPKASERLINGEKVVY